MLSKIRPKFDLQSIANILPGQSRTAIHARDVYDDLCNAIWSWISNVETEIEQLFDFPPLWDKKYRVATQLQYIVSSSPQVLVNPRYAMLVDGFNYPFISESYN